MINKFTFICVPFILQYLSGHFDTHIGSKREHSSYLKIADELSVDPQDVLFLTDIPAGKNTHLLLNQSSFSLLTLCRSGSSKTGRYDGKGGDSP